MISPAVTCFCYCIISVMHYRGMGVEGGWYKATMARNANANVDILYKRTIDEIRLRVISDLQAGHEYS